MPERAVGHRGRPGLVWSRGGRAFSPLFALHTCDLTPGAARFSATDATELELELELSGLLRVRHTLRNDGTEAYALHELACVLPVPNRASELLDLTGRWLRERHPQRYPFVLGTYLREGRHGRTGHDATLLLCSGTPGFGNRNGEVWGVHLGWSGTT